MPNELNEPVDVTLLVTSVLEALQIPYFIGGSLASIVYGEYRATADVDIVADIHMQHATPLVQALRADFFVQLEDIHDAMLSVELHRNDQRYRPSFSLIHLATNFKVDVFLFTGRPFERSQFARRAAQVFAVEPERTAYVASAEDIVLAKLEWYELGGRVSDRQWRDLLAVLKTQGTALNIAYLRQWAQSLGIADLLELALQDAGLGPR